MSVVLEPCDIIGNCAHVQLAGGAATGGVVWEGVGKSSLDPHPKVKRLVEKWETVALLLPDRLHWWRRTW